MRIADSKGSFILEDGAYASIDEITKEDLLRLVDLILANDVDFDEYSEETIKHPAHQIIYKSVFDKFKNLSDRKQEFADQSDRIYLSEYERYREEEAPASKG